MKPNTRLLIRLGSDDNMSFLGYDEPFYKTQEALRADIEKDFQTIPDNTEIRLFYYDQEGVVEAETGKELADKAIQWLISTGNYN